MTELFFLSQKKASVTSKVPMSPSIRKVVNGNASFKVFPFCDIKWPMFLKNTIYHIPELGFIWVAFKQDIRNIILFTQLHI